jgi:hypothetical protein
MNGKPAHRPRFIKLEVPGADARNLAFKTGGKNLADLAITDHANVFKLHKLLPERS